MAVVNSRIDQAKQTADGIVWAFYGFRSIVGLLEDLKPEESAV